MGHSVLGQSQNDMASTAMMHAHTSVLGNTTYKWLSLLTLFAGDLLQSWSLQHPNCDGYSGADTVTSYLGNRCASQALGQIMQASSVLAQLRNSTDCAGF